jgi:hypothetical protein
MQSCLISRTEYFGKSKPMIHLPPESKKHLPLARKRAKRQVLQFLIHY